MTLRDHNSCAYLKWHVNYVHVHIFLKQAIIQLDCLSSEVSFYKLTVATRNNLTCCDCAIMTRGVGRTLGQDEHRREHITVFEVTKYIKKFLYFFCVCFLLNVFLENVLPRLQAGHIMERLLALCTCERRCSFPNLKWKLRRFICVTPRAASTLTTVALGSPWSD